jgi:hypothetical protein
VSAYSLSGHDTPKRYSQTQDGFAERLLHIYAEIWVKGLIGAMVRGTTTLACAREHHPNWFRESIK